MTNNTLFFGDNLAVLREHIRDESVDLIYLDPPFNSNRSYNVLFRDESGSESDAQIKAFDDTWHWGPAAAKQYTELLVSGPQSVGRALEAFHTLVRPSPMLAYLVMMAARLVELHRVLKPTGSLYLHCDPTASHYLKLLLDAIFGPENFRNEIVWKRTSAHSSANRYGSVHDILLFYSKSDKYTWNQIHQSYDEKYLQVKYRNEDAKGKYRLSDLTGAGKTQGDSGRPWRDIDPSLLGRHWAVPSGIIDEILGEEASTPLSTQEKLDLLDANGYIYWPIRGKNGQKTGFPRYKRYLTEGLKVQDVFDDIPPVNSQARERLNYPTQKPEALLERIIAASSNPGDVVLDPFCGCGTAVAAAHKLGRAWIGIDITHLSVALMKYRLRDAFGLAAGQDYRVIGEPADLGGARALALEDRYQFQFWALGLVEARPLGAAAGEKQGKKGADRGIDGVINFVDDAGGKAKRAIVQVKSGKVKSGDVRDLRGVLDREGAQIGLFITLEPPTREMIAEASQPGDVYDSPGWGRGYARVQVLSIEDLLSGKKPEMPPPWGTFKQAPKANESTAETLRLPGT